MGPKYRETKGFILLDVGGKTLTFRPGDSAAKASSVSVDNQSMGPRIQPGTVLALVATDARGVSSVPGVVVTEDEQGIRILSEGRQLANNVPVVAVTRDRWYVRGTIVNHGGGSASLALLGDWRRPSDQRTEPRYGDIIAASRTSFEEAQHYLAMRANDPERYRAAASSSRGPSTGHVPGPKSTTMLPIGPLPAGRRTKPAN